MLVALLGGLTVQAATPALPAPSLLTPPTLSSSFTLTEPALEYSSMPAVQRDTYGEGAWLLTGLALLGGGAVVMGVAGVGMAATDNTAIDTIFSWTGLFGAVHFVVGASMLGIELTEGRSARVVFTGNGIAGSF